MPENRRRQEITRGRVFETCGGALFYRRYFIFIAIFQNANLNYPNQPRYYVFVFLQIVLQKEAPASFEHIIFILQK